MRDCPEMRDLAHFVETGEGSPDMVAHIESCDACQEARSNFEDEAMSLQISISELWFREQISCPDAPTLERFRGKSLGGEERAYVEFHLEILECPTCQARLGESEVTQSPEARGSAFRSRRKVADATSRLLGDLKKGKGR
jgi:hypothetical protein